MSELKSHSQYGEDLAIWKCVHDAIPPRLLDIGAWAAIEFSNSRLLIENGWEAVLIEPSPGPLRGLASEYGPHGRYHDKVTIVGSPMSAGVSPLIKLQVTDDAVSSSEFTTQNTWKEKGGYYGEIWYPTVTIGDITNQFGGGFSFISIDAEGVSVAILKSIIEAGHRPICFCVEHDDRHVEIAQIVQPFGYAAVMTNQTNVVLERRG